MADYMAVTRTNYFHVKDAEVFKEIVSQICDDMEVFTCEMSDGSMMYGFGGYGFITGFGGEDEDVDQVYNALRDHVAMPDEAIVIEEIGCEKLRYLSAYATVITEKEVDFVDLKEEVKKRIPTEFPFYDEY